MGSKNQGQGHETTFKQILHERLGLDPADVRYIDGDTERVGFGMGTMGSRSTVIGGTALWTAADKVIAKGKKIAARLLEAAEADITFADGKFSVVGTDRAVVLKDVARAAFQPAQLPPGLEPGLYETGTFVPKQDTWPNGCHVCEAEIDPDTGAVTLASYVIVDDVGTVINPVTLKGQIHGGVAQGMGQALMEQVVYDAESGQLLTASFMDYAMPRADTMGEVELHENPVPTKLNPLGVKGAGEAGTGGALPAGRKAALDAPASGPERDEAHRHLAVDLVLHAEGGGFGHVGVLEQTGGDLEGGDVHAALDDDVLLASRDVDVAIGVAPRQIAVAEAVLRNRLEVFRPAPVRGGELTTAHHHLALLADRDLAASVVE